MPSDTTNSARWKFMLNRHSLRKFFVVLSVAAGSLIVTPDVKAKEIVGVVTSVSGTWFANDVKVSQGQKLVAGAVIKAKEPNTRYSRVVIMLLDFTEVSRICDRRGFCGEPIRLPDTVEESTRADTRPPAFWERFVTAVNRSRKPRHIKSMARGGGTLPDGVVRLENGGVNLAPVFSGVAEREILLNIEAIRNVDGETSGMIAERLSLKWKGGRRAVVQAPNMKPGLYRITFAAPDGGNSSALPGDVWVLAVESSKYQRPAAEYRMARAATASWDSKAEPQADDFLREFLLALANERAR